MNTQNPTLIQRLLADTPDFFKKADFIGYGLLLIAAIMAYFKLPAEASTVVATIGASFSGLSKFAVKDSALFAQGITGDALTQMVVDLGAQFAELKTILSTPTPLPTIENAFQDLAAAVKDNTAAKPAEAAAPAAQEATVVSISAPAPDPAA